MSAEGIMEKRAVLTRGLLAGRTRASEAGVPARPSFLSWALAGLLFLIPLTAIPGLNSPFQLPQTLLLRFGAFALCALWLGALVLRKDAPLRAGALGWPVGIFTALCALSSLRSPDPFTSLFGSHELWFWGLWSVLSYAGIYFLAVNADAGGRDRYLGALAASSALVSLYAISQRLGWDPLWPTADPSLYAFTSTLGNPNYLGVFTAMGVPACLYFCFRAGRGWRLAAGAAACLNFLVCALALTRGAWLGLAAGLFLWALLAGEAWKRARMTAAVLLLSFIGLGAYAVWPTTITGSSPVLDRSKVIADPSESSAAARLSLWKSALRIAADHPLGVGLDLFGQAFPRYQETVHRRQGGALKVATNAHNEPLQVAATLGLPGLAAYLWLWFGALRLFLRKWRSGNSEDRLFWSSVAAAGLALQIHAMFNFSVAATSAYLWTFWGLLAAPSDGNGPARRRPLGLKALLFAAVAGAGMLAARQGLAYALADRHFKQGSVDQAFLRWEKALAEYVSAREISANYYPAYMRSAGMHIALAGKYPARAAAHLRAARDVCAAAYEAFPRLPEAAFNLGTVYGLLHKSLGEPVLDESLRYIKIALEEAPMYPEFWTGYAKALDRAGRSDEAKQALAAALRIVPTYAPAMKQLASRLPQKSVNFVDQDIVLRGLAPGRPVRISEAAGKVLKLMNLESEEFHVELRIVPVADTPFVLPQGYRPAPEGIQLVFDRPDFPLKSNSIEKIDGTIQLPDSSGLRGGRIGVIVLARLRGFDLPVGAYARLLMDMEDAR